jgi:hypothetical protein
LHENLAMAWALCALCAIVPGIREWVWYRREERLLADDRLAIESPQEDS